MLMLLSASTEMDPELRLRVSKDIIKGFNDTAKEAGTEVTGGQSVMNPWPIIGGVASAVCTPDEFIMPENAEVGDVLVLTKPLGIQIAVNAHQWYHRKDKNFQTIENIVSPEKVAETYQTASKSMSRLNINAARLMHKYHSHGATDVTGFGLLGHSNNLARNQKRKVHFKIHTLPLIKTTKLIDESMNFRFNLLKGTAAETSGGILVAMKRNDAEGFMKELEEIDKAPCWIVGDVIQSPDESQPNQSIILPDATIVEVVL